MSCYIPGLDSFEFGGRQRIVKLLKFLKLQPDGSLLVSLSDSNNFVFGAITPSCISNYERENHCRITENTTNCLIFIRQVKLRWLSRRKFANQFGNLINMYPYVCSFAVLEIDEVEMFDADQTEYLVRLEPVYITDDYYRVVKPYQIKEPELQCL